MISKFKLSLLVLGLPAISVSPSLMAAGRCDSARTLPVFELVNAPAEEMQKNQSIAEFQNCVFAAEFVSRTKGKQAAPPSYTQSAPASGNGTYVPKTKDDNTPWRFDMSQNGKRMTAEEFDAWMKAKGIRVATGKPGAEAPAAIDCKQSKEAKC